MEQTKSQKYTYSDYLTWNDDQRYELIDGNVYMMTPSPSPSSTHQKISVELLRQLANYLQGKICEVYAAPFDVRLNADAEDDTVVQPDITVICDPSKIDERGCKGVPDMIIEILSPSTTQRDQVVKLNRYLKAGVREYWIVSPEARSVHIHLLTNEQYVIQAYDETANVPVNILEDCQINLAKVFPPILRVEGPNSPKLPIE